ncbi:39S ribosomal protein L3, mitochondrial-like [Centruroides sculpturatus]|uniref:39S ribosomal protein L3, mitochondrial-like n=1 Tax=Centruroides sculpturatus TaxID=218467 RepID=UPI000C6E4626|nr:39S ribosomal protein L3, mitochondrial-like [Centruroides sculpturatus]
MRFGPLHNENGRLGCLIVGAESVDPQRFSAEYIGLFNEAGVMPKRKLTKFYITPNAALQPGTPLYATHFRPGDYVDVWGKTIGHGFQGVVKRWGFKGGPASHGSTKFHRKPGYIGGGSKRGVMRGKKLPGHMGQERRMLRGLKIWRINTVHNVIWVQGPAVPGSTHAFVYIFDSSVKDWCHTEESHPPFPTYFPDDAKEPLPEELYDKELHNFSDPTITFENVEVKN